MRLSVFVDSEMGFRVLRYLTSNYPDHVQQVVVVEPWEGAVAAGVPSGCPVEVFDQVQTPERIRELGIEMVLLAWWPKIVRQAVIEAASVGVINLHPSLLPHNRGKNYWFWNLVEDVPYGVSIHFVEPTIDSGEVLFQREIPKTWEDTGESLFDRAKIEMLSLFAESYPKIVRGEYERKKQNLESGSYHHSSELAAASTIDLDEATTARALLNRLRARTSRQFRQCTFNEDGEKFEVGIEIRKVPSARKTI